MTYNSDIKIQHAQFEALKTKWQSEFESIEADLEAEPEGEDFQVGAQEDNTSPIGVTLAFNNGGLGPWSVFPFLEQLFQLNPEDATKKKIYVSKVKKSDSQISKAEYLISLVVDMMAQHKLSEINPNMPIIKDATKKLIDYFKAAVEIFVEPSRMLDVIVNRPEQNVKKAPLKEIEILLAGNKNLELDLFSQKGLLGSLLGILKPRMLRLRIVY